MKNRYVVTLMLGALLALGGCASSLSGDVYSRDDARAPQTVRMGTVESVRLVQIEGTKIVAARLPLLSAQWLAAWPVRQPRRGLPVLRAWKLSLTKMVAILVPTFRKWLKGLILPRVIACASCR